ncbi:hypothetical protein PGT21_033931 [Puccinia graminis f. sp. tritici]|uniref:BED-type domain-containing protein n=1 Tax=Puccinia graminis f. sp. tritici TaxID=56615 RepID=A0A5B0QCD9_PUCGR|nr:hypothetical protein PGT21_033931 [Puccinia graminis f. sp. tritici]
MSTNPQSHKSASVSGHPDSEVSDSNAGPGYATNQSNTQLRRSSRASSLVTAPNMVTPASDSRVRLNRPATAQVQKHHPEASSDQEYIQGAAPSKAKAKSKNKRQRRKPPSPADHTSNRVTQPKKRKAGKSASNTVEVISNDETYNYDQDSDSVSILNPKRLGEKSAKGDGFAHPLDYFHPPTWKEGDPHGTKLNFKCRWCDKTYRGQLLSNGNLKTHRDGSTQADKNPKGCLNREQAKKAGIILPLSVAKTRALQDNDQVGSNLKLQFKPTFVNRVLNQIIMMWQIRQALPWTRIEDPYLRAAFLFANPKAVLYGRRWSADESKNLYTVLKSHVFEELNNLDTKFTLIHDVWTTKGNRFAFIGAAVAYVDQNWEYVVWHLGLKMIPWKHRGYLLARPIVTILKKNNLHHKRLRVKQQYDGECHVFIAQQCWRQ